MHLWKRKPLFNFRSHPENTDLCQMPYSLAAVYTLRVLLVCVYGMDVCMYVCMHVCMYVCMYLWYVCMICIYDCMHVCMYLCMYV